ncbi:helix-turn-helix transcriptional regulator [Niallia sp. JL1B1071]|uniref:helix-turn-helix transcriptional regulator n=1 Tax=Niallia tiangongensis TaxID=3237105 RepID=UPI0037DC6006
MKKEWLISIRKAKNMTQEQVASFAFIDRSYYSQIESGKRNPSIGVAYSIALVLEFDPLYFFQHENIPLYNESFSQISDFFISAKKGFVLYSYENHTKYLEHAIMFLVTSITKGKDCLVIDNSQNLLSLESKLSNLNQSANSDFFKNIHFYDSNNEIDMKFILDRIISNPKIMSLWINHNPPYNVDSFIDQEDLEAFNTSDILFVKSYNGDEISAKWHLKMMRMFKYLMTDNEIVHSPLNRSGNQSVYPSLYKF